MSFERSNIANMQGYVPGEQPKQDNVIKLNTNENPYPASPQVQAALEGIRLNDLRLYPQALAKNFRQVAAERHGVKEENIIPTNGGDELLRLALTTFADSGEIIATTQPSYSLYPVLACIQDCNLIEIPLLDDWSMPEDFIDQLNSLQAKMCLLVNPHAPTGKLITVDSIKKIASNFPGVLIIDEAYVDFVDPSESYNCVPLIREYENILILRTLSKGYSLAGLRFGYGIAHKTLANPMMFKTRDSYNTDHIAQKLATAALQARDYVEANWETIRNSRTKLTDALNQLGLVTGSSQTNFVLSQVPAEPGAEALYAALQERNILVRYFRQPRLEDKLRISIGSEQENAALITAITEIVAGQAPRV
ncbi:MAG: histidinol-phosphate transaminase [Gammaproteobacteria bacterium]|nr:histidinol-phosphate transaminase [Gammaproteobacteria bacterium]MDD9959005.1 histidinol-phosphate transaminase [Gammaproteobacteria bacterium]